MRLYEAVCHGAEHGNSIQLSGENVGAACPTCQIGGSCHLKGGIGPMGTTRTEIHDCPALCRCNHSGRLGRCKALKMNLVQNEGLQQLRLEYWRDHLQ